MLPSRSIFVLAPLCATSLLLFAEASRPRVDARELQGTRAAEGVAASAMNSELAAPVVAVAEAHTSEYRDPLRAKNEGKSQGSAHSWIVGTVVDEVGGAPLRHGRWTSSDESSTAALADGGRFRIDAAGAAGSPWVFRAKGYGTLVADARGQDALTGSTAATAEVDWGVMRAPRAQGAQVLISLEDGSPASGARVRFVAVGPRPRAGAASAIRQISCTSDGAGRLTDAAQLTPGAWRIRAELPYRLVSESVLYLPAPDAAAEVRVVVAAEDPMRCISGSVVDEMGQPVEGAVVRIGSGLDAIAGRGGEFLCQLQGNVEGAHLLEGAGDPEVTVVGPAGGGFEPWSGSMPWGARERTVVLERARDLELLVGDDTEWDRDLPGLKLYWSLLSDGSSRVMQEGEARRETSRLWRLSCVPSAGQLQLCWSCERGRSRSELRVEDATMEPRQLSVSPPLFEEDPGTMSAPQPRAHAGRLEDEGLRQLRDQLGGRLALGVSLLDPLTSQCMGRAAVDPEGKIFLPADILGSFEARLEVLGSGAGPLVDLTLVLGSVELSDVGLAPAVLEIPALELHACTVLLTGKGEERLTLRQVDPAGPLLACSVSTALGDGGRAFFHALPAGLYRAEAGSETMSSRRIRIPATSPTIELVAQRATGPLQLIDTLGEPIMHRSFGFRLKGGGWERTLRSDDSGRLTLRDCPLGTLEVMLLEWKTPPRPGDQLRLGGPKTRALVIAEVPWMAGASVGQPTLIRCAY
ncbi:MAG: hypothetical protein AAGG01_04165 [Planctomycetota bacterium]